MAPHKAIMGRSRCRGRRTFASGAASSSATVAIAIRRNDSASTPRPSILALLCDTLALWWGPALAELSVVNVRNGRTLLDVRSVSWGAGGRVFVSRLFDEHTATRADPPSFGRRSEVDAGAGAPR
ncbi:hypothetical protein ACFQU9_17195 [Actinomadura namibiensis]|uniref:Uncharacterized protein n=1 Tax=Actinomadura namibiensis TaxID=182080 RepID=A0A7W3QN11_ACTNM|nr:hypothetical protein [Actinomadura namibiensis]MBA8953110.1 hypothetical protein [Actinomadura namibiensis]